MAGSGVLSQSGKNCARARQEEQRELGMLRGESRGLEMTERKSERWVLARSRANVIKRGRKDYWGSLFKTLLTTVKIWAPPCAGQGRKQEFPAGKVVTF